MKQARSVLLIVSMTRRAILLGSLVASVPGVAAACPSAIAPYVTLGDLLPAARSGVPRDGAVVVRATLWPAAGGTSAPEVHVTDEAGAALAVVGVPWTGGLAYRFADPLPPHRRFTVEAVVPPGGKPPGADGPQRASATFETGDALASPLELAGPLQVRVEEFDQDVISCASFTDCGPTNCPKTGTRRALRAKITVPPASGGVDVDGYRGELYATDDQPLQPPPDGGATGVGLQLLLQKFDARPGAQTELASVIGEGPAPDARCFGVKLSDPAGHLVQTGPACLSAGTACTATPGRPAAVPWPLGIALAAACLLTRASRPRPRLRR
jgi:hypothetical protein